MTLTIDADRYVLLLEENRRLRLCLDAAHATIEDLQIVVLAGDADVQTAIGAAYLQRLTARIRRQA